MSYDWVTVGYTEKGIIQYNRKIGKVRLLDSWVIIKSKANLTKLGKTNNKYKEVSKNVC